jgi:citrate synthase
MSNEQTAKIILEGKEFEYPVIVGTENEKAVDTSKLRSQTGYITYDDGYANTGSCKSSITFHRRGKRDPSPSGHPD